MGEALDALQSDNAVTVIEQKVFPWSRPLYVFEPKNAPPEKGFIFYPGGLVDPRSYAPPLHRLAAMGYLTIIVPMPGDLAVFGANRAWRVMRLFNSIGSWAIGGHSLGGVMACRYARADRKGAVRGVVLWAAYPSATYSLAGRDIDVISIYGTNDGLTTLDEIEASRSDLPDDAQFVEIDGGNHTQFGHYGDGEELQKGDNTADINREQQQQRIVDATAAFLNNL